MYVLNKGKVLLSGVLSMCLLIVIGFVGVVGGNVFVVGYIVFEEIIGNGYVLK